MNNLLKQIVRKISVMFLITLSFLMFTSLITKASTDAKVLEKTFTYSPKENLVIEKIIGGGNDEFLIIGSIQYESNLQQDEAFNPYIAYYKNDKMMWEKIDANKEKGKVIDALITDDEIVVCGSYEKEAYYLFVQKYAKTSNMTTEKVISGNDVITPVAIHVYKDHYLLTGTTFSKNGALAVSDAVSKVFVTSLYNETLETGCTTLYGNDGKNYLKKAVINGGSLFLYVSLSGTGYFTNNYGFTTFDGIIKCDDRTDFEEFTTLPILPDTTNDITINPQKNAPIFASNQFSTQQLTLYQYDNIIDEYEKITVLFPERIYQWALSSDQSDELLIAYKTAEEVVVNRLVNNELIPIITKKVSSDFKLFSPTSINGFTILLGKTNSQPATYKRVELIIDEDGLCYLDGQKIAGRQEGTYDQNTYGVYDVKYIYLLDGNDYEVMRQITVPLVVNIKDQQQYDVGIKLHFNCEASLDYQPISSGYAVLEEGVHVLQLKGHNTQATYTFVVKKNSLDINKKEESEQFYADIDTYSLPKEQTNEVSTHLSQKIVDNKNVASGIYIAVIIAIIGLSIGVLLPVRKKQW